MRATTLLAVTAFATCVVCESAASAQSYGLLLIDSRSAPVARASLIGIDAMRVYAAETPDSIVTDQLPSNLVISKTLKPVAEKMLQRSRTFRRQCVRIANAPHLSVTIASFHPLPSEHARARTRFERRDGVLYAEIQIAPLNDQVELIAHEIEHVIEQLDGVDLTVQAALRSAAVSRTEDGSFETVRAVRMGLAVTREVETSF